MTTDTLVTDAMTAPELFAGIQSLRAGLGKSGSVSLIMGSGPSGAPVYIILRPDGYGVGKVDHSITGTSWSETLAAARQWIANYKITSRDTTIRKMALAIIDLTDTHGECTDAMLTRHEFSADQIQLFHEAACQRAGEMAAGTPFRVVFGKAA